MTGILSRFSWVLGYKKSPRALLLSFGQNQDWIYTISVVCVCVSLRGVLSVLRQGDHLGAELDQRSFQGCGGGELLRHVDHVHDPKLVFLLLEITS